MEAKELRMEQVSNLRRLKQHPGWALYQARLQQLLAERDREKAVHLRKGDHQKAIILQGQVDGIQEAYASIDFLIKEVELTMNDMDAPAY